MIDYHYWGISTKDCRSSLSRSLFFQGNGRLGLRASCPLDEVQSYEHGMFMAGCFETLHDNITDMVNLPDILCFKISDKAAYAMSQSLDFKSGVLRREWETDNAYYAYERTLSFANRSLLGHMLTVRPKKDFEAQIEDYMDTDVVNLPVNDDQTKINTQTVKLFDHVKLVKSPLNETLSFSTSSLSHELVFIKQKEGYCPSALKQGEVYELKAVCSVDIDQEPVPYSQMKEASMKALESIWGNVFKLPFEDEKLLSAIRFNIFTLIQNAPDNDFSIGARGLSHGRYKGNYFWDAEVFMLPAYLKIMPSAAYHILKFRYNTLQQAIENAKSMNLKGARYPWMCSTLGLEQCESWDTGCCEIHVTADVAWAFEAYVKATRDLDFERSYACKVYKETALYWLSRFSYNKKSDSYNMLFVKGPDEYCGVTSNNAYTTLMALHNIKLALDAKLEGLIELEEKDVSKMEEICRKAKVPYSEELGTYLEDDNYENLEDFDLKQIKDSDCALYHKICFDRLQRLKVIKQPDVLLLYILLPDLFSKDQALSAWEEYEKYTSHDSTLSWGMHALAAFRMGLKEQGRQYFEKALFLDLENLMGNTASEGLHVGAAGAAVQALLEVL